MKGKCVHEKVLLGRMEKQIRESGVAVRRQVPAGSGRTRRYADLVAFVGTKRLIIEAEMSSKRVAGDLLKALDLGASWLWIVTPTQRVARSVRRRLRKMGIVENEPWLCVLPLGQAIESVRHYLPLFSIPKVTGKRNAKSKQ